MKNKSRFLQNGWNGGYLLVQEATSCGNECRLSKATRNLSGAPSGPVWMGMVRKLGKVDVKEWWRVGSARCSGGDAAVHV
jgi:hypothetical protein